MGWSSSLSQKVILFITILFVALYLFFPSSLYSVEWILSAFLILVMVFNQLNILSSKWNRISEKVFIKWLFGSAFLLRLAFMLVLLWISYSTWDMFYLVGAKDEMVYYRIANEAREIWADFTLFSAFSHISASYRGSISDSGFSTFLLLVMHIIGNTPIVIKTFLCFIGSLTVVRGYKLASFVLERPAARLAAIFLMLYPISWFYSAVMLKEGIMVLMITEVLLQTIKLQKSFRISSLMKTLLLIIIVFFFRSAISILLAIVVGFSLFMQFKRKQLVRNILIGIGILTVYIFFLKSTGKYDDYYEQYTDIDSFTEERLSYMETINPFVAVAGTPVFAMLAFIAPFPSVVSVPVRDGLSHNEYYYHIAGNIFWIVLAFFSIYGVYYAIRYNRLEMAPLWSFIIGYQLVLLKAMMFTSVRYSYPAKPFLLIMAAYGLYRITSKK